MLQFHVVGYESLIAMSPARAAHKHTFPIEDIPIVLASDLVSGQAVGGLLDATPIAATSIVERRPPVFLETTWVQPRLLGSLEKCFASTSVAVPTLHLLTLKGALLVGQGSVVVSSDRSYKLLFDSAREFLANRRVPEGMSLGPGGLFALTGPVDRLVRQRCLLLQRPWANNFGHWIVDQAMALSYLVRTGALQTRTLVVGKVPSSKMREIMLQTIDAVLPGAAVLEHPYGELWAIRRLDYMMPMHIPPMFKLPAALDSLREHLLAASPASPVSSRRLYLARSGGPRILDNENEIRALTAAYDFEPVTPEAFSITEQAAMFRDAVAVFGSKGAAMTNIFCSNPDTRLMVMSPGNFTDTFFWDIASVRGIAYAEAFGETTSPATANVTGFRMEPAMVRRMIEAALSAPSWSKRAAQS